MIVPRGWDDCNPFWDSVTEAFFYIRPPNRRIGIITAQEQI